MPRRLVNNYGRVEGFIARNVSVKHFNNSLCLDCLKKSTWRNTEEDPTTQCKELTHHAFDYTNLQIYILHLKVTIFKTKRNANTK
jgi:hypothetical protein